MGSTNALTLCRICLVDGATCPIFSEDECDTDIYLKLSMCFHEKFSDEDGYPRNICTTCNDTLNLLHDFVTRFKNSTKILEGGLLHTSLIHIKNENVEVEYYNNEVYVEIETNDLQEESPNDSDQKYDNKEDILLKRNNMSQETANQKKFSRKCKSESRIRDQKCRPLLEKSIQRKTGTIATSFLEGCFEFDGENWCKSKKTRVRRRKKAIEEKKAKPKQSEKKPTREKNDVQNSSLLCDICGESFTQAANLSKHRKVKHFPDNIPCPHCEVTCKTDISLERHVRTKHTKRRDFVCTDCGFAFAFQSDLNTHSKIHQRDKYPKKMYSCSHCDKTYNSKQSVTIHERSVHTGDKPSVCTVCNKRFVHYTYLKEHMRIHTGETPYKCPICGRGYSQNGNMKSHIRNKHKRAHLDEATLSKLKPSILKYVQP